MRPVSIPSTIAGWPLTFYSGLRHITAAAATLRMTTPNAVDIVVASKNGEEDGITDFSLASPLTMELANESVTGEFVQGREVIGARWTLDSEVSSWCTSLPASS